MRSANRIILSTVVSSLGLLLCLARVPIHADPPPALPRNLDATLRKLETQIAEVRGLKFKSPVSAKVIPRPKGTPGKLQGYYSIKDKALFIYDDLSGAYERGVLIH